MFCLVPTVLYCGINELYSYYFKAEELCEKKTLEFVPSMDQDKNLIVSNATSLPSCPFNPFLLDEVIFAIGENAKTDLPTLQLLNKKWKGVTDVVYANMFLEIQHLVFGKRKYEEYMHTYGQDLGPEVVPHLPYKVYDDLKNDLCMVTWFPSAVPVRNEKIEVVLKVAPGPGVMGELVQNPKKGNKTGFTPNKLVLFHLNKEIRDIKGDKWVVTYKANLHKDMVYSLQSSKAEKLGKGTDVIDLDETVFAVFMHYIETGEMCFLRDSANRDYSMVRTKKLIDNNRWRVSLGFEPYGCLHVDIDDDTADERRGVAFARQSIDTCILGDLKN